MPTYRVRVHKTRTVTETFEDVVEFNLDSVADVATAAHRYVPPSASWVRGIPTLPHTSPVQQIEVVPATSSPAFTESNSYNARGSRGSQTTGAEGMPVAIVETRNGYNSSRTRRIPSRPAGAN